MSEQSINTASPQRFSLWHRLGFGEPAYPRFDDIPDDHPLYAPAFLATTSIVHLDWRDRLRALVSGRVMVRVSSKTDVTIRRVLSRAKTAVLPPSWPLDRCNFPK